MKTAHTRTNRHFRDRFLKFQAVGLVIVALTIPSVSYAWNIICIISDIHLFSKDDGKSMKWEIDAHALRGIGQYFMAVSELQRVELRDDESLIVPQSVMNTDASAIQQAIQFLSNSESEFTSALTLAAEHKLGDKQGLELLSQVQGEIAKIRETIESGVLPELAPLQGVAIRINEAVNHGISLSNHHLTQGMPGHGKGGVEY